MKNIGTTDIISKRLGKGNVGVILKEEIVGCLKDSILYTKGMENKKKNGPFMKWPPSSLVYILSGNLEKNFFRYSVLFSNSYSVQSQI